jgi:type II secretory pathway pseudopilin PulG
MELASILVNLGIFAVTAVAAIIAWRSVRDAQKARDAAQVSETRALAAAEKSAASSDRSATAQERIAEIAETTARPEEPWIFEQLSGERWKVTNNMRENVDFVAIGSVPEGLIQTEHRDVPQDVARGQSLYFLFGGGLGDPASVNIKIVWRSASGGEELVRSIP